MIRGSLVALLLLAGCAAEKMQTEMEPCPTCNGKSAAENEHPQPSDDLLRRAAFDLQCAKEQLKAMPLEEPTWHSNPHSWGVVGCGRQAVYVLPSGCNPDSTGSAGCTWLLNTPVQQVK